MSDQNPYNPQDLIALSKIDISIGHIIAEGKNLDKSALATQEKLKKIAEKLKVHQDGTSKLKAEYNREAQDLKFHQEKLTTRRKALSNLGNAKAQVAAEREVDSTAKALEAREEKLLEVMIQLEDYEKNIKELEIAHNATEAELKDVVEGAKAHRNLLAERRAEKDAERAKLVEQIPADFVRRYETVLRRHLLDPIVAINNDTKTCGGCGMMLAPQMILKVTKATAPIQCPGCARILYLVPKSE